MAQKKTKSEKVTLAAVEKSLTAVSSRLSSAASKRRGGILLHFTDLNEEFCLEGTEDLVRVATGVGTMPALVRVSGPSSVLKAVMDGKKEASRAFIAGGIQASGDLVYLETLLKEVGLLNCE